MAADQRRKRLNGASIVAYSSSEQHRAKRRNLGLVLNGFNMKSHISVAWDGNKRRVVAKREQVGIRWRDIRPFIHSVPQDHSHLADVFSVPEEIFELDNLLDVLSCEVWQTHLSENERSLLLQFLPRGLDPDDVVHKLLDGENFHFGNPALKWGASLCSGNAHPDAIIKHLQYLKSEKREYYTELQKYHNDMIVYLIKLKERWERSKDPEDEIVPKLWRSRTDWEKRISLNSNGSRLCDIEANVTATSESCSWAADEKVCSDNQISSVRTRDNQKRRIMEKRYSKERSRNSTVASDDMVNVGTRPKKGDKLQNRNILCSDGAGYMSYLRISKKQLELVKSIKQSGKSVQSKSLVRILGNLDGFDVQPYELFVEEEQKKLHKHWLLLVNNDLPTAYANWRDRKIQIRKMAETFLLEMADKLKTLIIEDEDNVSLGSEPLDHEDDGQISNQSEPQDVAETSNQYKPPDEMDNGGTGNESNMEVDCSVFGSPQNQSPQETSCGGGHGFNSVNVNLEKNLVMSTVDDASPVQTEYARNVNSGDDAVSQGASLSSGGEVWQSDDTTHSYFESNVSHSYASVSRLSVANPQINEEQPRHLIGFEPGLHGEVGKEVLHSQSGDGSFTSYPDQDRNDMLQSLFKGQGVHSYHQEQKGADIDFQAQNNIMVENGPFPGHFKEPLQPSLALEQGLKRHEEAYPGVDMSGNLFYEDGRYLIPRHDHLSQVNLQDWNIRGVSMSVPSQSHLINGGFSSQHWFPNDHQFRGGWTGSGRASLPGQSIGNGGNSDQTLYGVLSQCSQLPSGSTYQAARPPDWLLAPRTVGIMDAGAPRMNAVVPQASHQLNHLSGRDAASPMVPDDIAWMSLPHQSSGLHDQTGKPFLRSWNS